MSFLNNAYTKYNHEHTSWKNGLFHAIFILIIFLLFQPFGFRDKDLTLKLLLFPGYSFIAFFYNISKFHAIRRIIKSKKTWTLKNEIVSLIVTTFPLVLIIHIYSCWVSGDMPFNIHWYIKLLFYTTSFFILIYFIEYLYYSNISAGIQIRHLSSQIQLYSQHIAIAKNENTQSTVVISLEKGQLTINTEKLVFIESKGNYVEFWLQESDGVTKKLTKRARLHQVETDLENYIEFFRCHRAYIVNLKRTNQIRGNSKNARLILDDKNKEIPVSRTYFKTLTQKLEKIITI